MRVIDLLARRARRATAAPLSCHTEVPALAAFGITDGGGCLPGSRTGSRMMRTAMYWTEQPALLSLDALLGPALF